MHVDIYMEFQKIHETLERIEKALEIEKDEDSLIVKHKDE